MDVSIADITAEDLSTEERLVREAQRWLDRQVIAQECEWEPDHDLRLVIENATTTFSRTYFCSTVASTQESTSTTTR